MSCCIYEGREMLSGILGRGSYSKVYISKKDPKKAIKLLSKKESVTMAEVVILKSLQHENVLSLTEFCIIDGRIAYIMDRCKYSFNKIITESRYKYKHIIDKIALDICKGLNHLHSNGFLHLDISLANCLIVNGTGKIADFSLSLYTDNIEKGIVSNCERITCTFRPYENLVSDKTSNVFNDKSDVWSLAIVLLSIFSGERFIDYKKNIVYYKGNVNYDVTALVHIEKLIAWGEWPLITIDNKWTNIISDMLCLDKEKRLSIKDVLNKLNIKCESDVCIVLPDINDFVNKVWYSHMTSLLIKYNISSTQSLFTLKLFANIEECFEFPSIYPEIMMFNIDYWMFGCIRIIDKLFSNNNALSNKKFFVKGEDIYIKIEECILKWRNGVII